MNKRNLTGLLLLAFLLVGGTVWAFVGTGSETKTVERSAVQGAVDIVEVDDSSKNDEGTAEDNANQRVDSVIPSGVDGSTSQTSTTTNNPVNSQTNHSSTNNDVSNQTDETGSDDDGVIDGNPGTTRGNNGSLDVIDIVPIDPGNDDDGGPSINPTPIRGGGLSGTITR